MSSIAKFYERRNSNKMSTQQNSNQPAMIAYRDTNGQIAYAPNPAAAQTPSYDSDNEPLITTTSNIDQNPSVQRFTATGQPIQPHHAHAMGSWAGDMYTAPNLLPPQFTDDSVIPAIVTNVIPRSKPAAALGVDASEGSDKRRKSFTKLFKSDKDNKAGKNITKVVFMPRWEYLKNFAKDNNGNYIGSEPARQWTEEELDEKFAKYKPEPTTARGQTLGFFSGNKGATPSAATTLGDVLT